MHALSVAALFAAFITTEQLLASAVVGVGVALVFGTIAQVRKDRRMLAEGDEPTTDVEEDDEPGSGKKGNAKKPLSPVVAGVLIGLGVVMLVGGIIWRLDAEG